jgi:hypothetical protein
MSTIPKPVPHVPAFRRRGLVAGVIGLLMGAILLGSADAPATVNPAQAAKQRTARAGRHPIVIVWLENHTARQISRAHAPFLKGLKSRGRYFTHYNGVSDPSLPNYLAFASGSTKGKRGSNSIRAGEIRGPTIWRQLSRAGVSWGVFQESMPRACFTSSQSSNRRTGPYVIRHNPAIPFADIRHSPACRRVKPLGRLPRKLPRVSFVTPAICNDMHGIGDNSHGASCRSGSSALVTRGDRWLRQRVPRWRRAGATVIITFDEGSGPLFTIAVGNGVRRSVDRRRYNHYSLLAALERRFHVPKLGHARSARPLPLGP